MADYTADIDFNDPQFAKLNALFTKLGISVADVTQVLQNYNAKGAETSKVLTIITDKMEKLTVSVGKLGGVRIKGLLDTGELEKQIAKAMRLLRQMNDRAERDEDALRQRRQRLEAQADIQTQNALRRLSDFRIKEAARVAAEQNKILNNQQAAVARTSTAALLGFGNLDPRKALRVDAALNSSLSGVRSGKMDIVSWEQLFQKIRTNQPFTALTKEEEKAEMALRRLFVTLKSFDDVGNNGRGLLLNMESIIRILQVQMLHRFFGEMIRGFEEGLIKAVEFEQAVARIRTISQEASLTTMQWKKELTELANNFNIPLLDATQAAYDLISNQVAKGSDATNLLGKAFQFAKVTGASAKESVDLLSFTINGMKLTASDADYIFSQMFKTIDLGNVTASQLAQNIGYVYPFAKQLGVGMEEVNVAIEVLTRQGIQADTTMTLLKNLFKEFVKPTQELDSLFKKWGVSSGQAAFQAFGLEGILHKLNEELKTGGIQALATYTDDLRGLQAALSATGKENLDVFRQGIEAGTQATEKYSEAIKMINETPAFKLTKEINELTTAFIKSGDTFIDVISKFNSKGGDKKGMIGELATLVDKGTGFFASLTVVFDKLYHGPLTKSMLPGLPGRPAVGSDKGDDWLYNPEGITDIYKIVKQTEEAEKETKRLEEIALSRQRVMNAMLASGADKEILAIKEKMKAATEANSAEMEAIDKAIIAKIKHKDINKITEEELKEYRKNSTEELKKHTKEVEKLIEKSKEYAQKVKDQTETTKFERSLEGLDRFAEVTKSIERISVLKKEAGEFFNVGNIEEARNKFEEAAKIIDKINKAAEKDIEKSQNNVKKIMEDRDDKAFQALIRGKSTSETSRMVGNRANSLIAQAFGTDDPDEARRLFDKAEKLAEKLNTVDAQGRRKKKRGVKGELAGDDLTQSIENSRIQFELQLQERLANTKIKADELEKIRLKMEEEFVANKEKEESTISKILAYRDSESKINDKLISDEREKIRLLEQELRATIALANTKATINGAPLTTAGPVASPAFAAGGMIHGPYGRDNLLIRAHAGEFIMNSEATKAFYPQIVAMNAGLAPRAFASGGPVTNVGDINVTMNGHESNEQNVRELGNLLRREIRRGTVKLT